MKDFVVKQLVFESLEAISKKHLRSIQGERMEIEWAENYEQLDYFRNEAQKWQAYSETLEKDNERLRGEIYSLRLKGGNHERSK